MTTLKTTEQIKDAFLKFPNPFCISILSVSSLKKAPFVDSEASWDSVEENLSHVFSDQNKNENYPNDFPFLFDVDEVVNHEEESQRSLRQLVEHVAAEDVDCQQSHQERVDDPLEGLLLTDLRLVTPTGICLFFVW